MYQSVHSFLLVLIRKRATGTRVALGGLGVKPECIYPVSWSPPVPGPHFSSVHSSNSWSLDYILEQ